MTERQTRELTVGYGTDGFVSQVQDASGQIVELKRDLSGRVKETILPDGRSIRYIYDSNGNITTLTPPGRSGHGFGYDGIEQIIEYNPPQLREVTSPQTKYDYNLDSQLEKITRPDGQTIILEYTPETGRLARVVAGLASQEIDYDAAGRIETRTDINGNRLEYCYDGFLTTCERWTGELAGEYHLTYNSDFKPIESQINGGNSIAYRYDADGLLIQAGEESLTRDALNGLLKETQLGTVKTTQDYNGFGEIKATGARMGESVLAEMGYEYDGLGRIREKRETVGGKITVIGYEYDKSGRLGSVKENGQLIETYTYDENGNRLNNNAVYDAQDRLLSDQQNQYSYTENGELKTKNNVSYEYDGFGNLRKVVLPDKTIEYVIDARNRRIGKKVNGELKEGFLYQGQLKLAAEADGNGKVVSQFVYGAKENVPDYFIKQGKTYRILSDHVESPRWVIDVENGAIIQEMQFDVWGRVVLDTNPGFQPFGFAGGLYDADTGLVRFGARDYDGESGRWTAKDPIGFNGDSANLYNYVDNDPINWIDPDGLCQEWWETAIDVASLALTAADILAFGPTGEGIAPAAGLQAMKQAMKKGAGETYEIIDGVRRSKAAELVGKNSIEAEVQIAGKVVEKKNIPLTQLRSPNKSEIDISSQPSNWNRWKNILDGTKAGDSLPPIIVQPGNRGHSISDVIFK